MSDPAKVDALEFRKNAHELVDWMADYLEQVESYPVRTTAKPGDILRQLPLKPPVEGEAFDAIMEDFKKIIVPGMTHWQHPSFFAYFPANNSKPSILAEMLTATLGAQCMSWITSPAATELEERVMEWLAGMIGLPPGFTGVIQDTASTATLCSILTAREAKSGFAVNRGGGAAMPRFTAYCSREAHSSVEKGVKIAGIGSEYLRKVDVDPHFALRPDALAATILRDIRNGFQPLIVVAALGTTGSTALDPLRPIGEICHEHNIWLHVDAAFAGSALLLPEYRGILDGIEFADTFVFNPHKWMFTNFDCSAYFVRDPGALIRTFEILPEYLKTPEDDRVNNYRDWGIQLGRRFRALKLWFVIRQFGVQKLQERIRSHILLARSLATKIQQQPDFELLAPVPLNTICFRYRPDRVTPEDALNRLNADLLEALNRTGKMYLTHTKLEEKYTIRLVVGQTEVQDHHVENAWKLILSTARGMA